MATEDRNGDLHSEKNGRFVSKGKSEAEKREEAERIYNDDASLERITSRRRTQPTNEFATLAMQWAHSDKTEIGEQKFFYRKGKWVLLEKSEDGFVEMNSYTSKQKEFFKEELKKRNERRKNKKNDE